MAIRASQGLVDKLAEGYGLRDLLRDMRFYVYDGTQPATGDLAPTGNNLFIFTLGGNTFTVPTRSNADITCAGTGTLDTVKVGGIGENLLNAPATITAGDLVTSAANVAAAINAKDNANHIIAVSDGVSKVTLHQPYHMGADGNGLTLAITQTTSTCTNDATFTTGVTAVNGLNMDYPAVDGVLSRPSGVSWKGTVSTAGTCGWFRAVAGGSLPGDAATRISFDGIIATSGGELDMGTLTVAAASVQTVASFTLTQPKA